ncbi:MAG: amino acid ABC transporter permease [Firmicutes bacterium]|jgi:polar amino acid transport system permease protein|nr:amino acid ABC transporter permease [Bacillota bacterium]
MEYLINIFKFMMKGSGVTLSLYFITQLFSIPLGLAAAVGKVSGNKWTRFLIDVYTWLFRGTPLMLQLFFFYYGLPVMGIRIGGFGSACLTFVLNYGAYYTEIMRSGIEAVDEGQHEACHCLGMSYWQGMLRVIIPQGIRKVIPPLTNESITLVKDTALVAAIGIGDVLRGAKQIVTRDFTIVPFVLAAVFYLAFTTVVVLFFRKIENKYSYFN